MNVQTARLTTKVLIGACAALVLLALAQYAGVGRGYRWAADAEGSATTTPLGSIDNKPVSLPPATAFADIEAHPLFNEDRQPSPYDPDEEGDAAPPPSPLNIALTGVILDEANHVRIAMLQDKARNQAIALKVGMPLEGDQASWTLVDVKPRGVTFKSVSNETTEVALETSLVQPPPPPKAAPRTPAKPPAGGKPNAPAGKGAPNAAPDPKGNSADLARRIEERRRQMREDADKLRNGGAAQPAPAKAPPKK
jgi:general secretion pathway protein N